MKGGVTAGAGLSSPGPEIPGQRAGIEGSRGHRSCVRWQKKQIQLDSTDPRHNPNLNRDQNDPEFWYNAARKPFNKAGHSRNAWPYTFHAYSGYL